MAGFPKMTRQKEKGRSDRAIITFNERRPDGKCKQKRVKLGIWGSREAEEKYNELKEKWLLAQAGNPRPARKINGILLTELFDLFLEEAERIYQRNGRPTGSADRYRRALLGFAEFVGPVYVEELTYSHLKKWQAFLDRSGKYTRGSVNKKVALVKSAFRWGLDQRLVPASIVAETNVTMLRRGRCISQDRPQVPAVPDSVISATLPYLSETLQTMVKFQRLTGFRPEEVRILRPIDIDRSESIWHYTPEHDKTDRVRAFGVDRVLSIGPRAQRLLEDYGTKYHRWNNPKEYFFRPADSLQALGRPLQSNVNECYSRSSYAYAIRKACEKAGAVKWTPYQLRHSRATEVEKEFGLTGAQAILGHASTAVTRRYIDPNTSVADRIAAANG